MSYVLRSARYSRMLIWRWSRQQSKLTADNLDRHNRGKDDLTTASINEMTKRFCEEQDSYRKFLITGKSAHHQQQKGESMEVRKHTKASGCRDDNILPVLTTF